MLPSDARLPAPTVPVEKLIAITGYGQVEDRRRAIAAGFDPHFVKPVDVTKVLAAVTGE